MRRSIAAIVIALSLLCLGVCADQIRLEPVTVSRRRLTPYSGRFCLRVRHRQLFDCFFHQPAFLKPKGTLFKCSVANAVSHKQDSNSRGAQVLKHLEFASSSNVEVASSNRSRLAPRRSVRASLNLCRCPLESKAPVSPISVSSPGRSAATKISRLAIVNASMMLYVSLRCQSKEQGWRIESSSNARRPVEHRQRFGVNTDNAARRLQYASHKIEKRTLTTT
jgi:hypothetical protein